MAALGRRALGDRALLLVLGAALLARLPSLGEPRWAHDEGVLAATATETLQGQLLYVQVWNVHQPLANVWMALELLVTRGWHPGMQLVLSLQVLAAAGALYGIAARLGGRAAPTALLFGLVMALPVVEGDLQEPEMIGLPLLCWAVLLGIGGGPLRAAAAGALAVAAALCHPGYLLDALCIPWFAVLSGRPLRLAPVLGGAAAAALAAAAVMAVAGDWAYYPALLDGERRLLIWANGGPELAPITLGLRLVPLGVALLGGLAIGSEQRTPGTRLVGAWLPLAAIDALLTPLGQLHLALPLVAPLCLLLGLWMRWELLAPALLGVVMAVQLAMLLPRAEMFLLGRWPFPQPEYGTAFNWTRLPAYYRGSYDQALGISSKEAYAALFPGHPADTEATAKAIRVEGRLLVWGDDPWLYAVSGRRQAGRYVARDASVAALPASDQQLIAAARQERPEYIVVAGHGSRELDALLRSQYDRLVFIPGPWRVYGLHSG